MNTCLTFLREVMTDMYNITQFEIISGVTIWTVLLYSLFASVLFTVFSRR